jgi:LmbE family N-acetylglucosaminyl deacetylase
MSVDFNYKSVLAIGAHPDDIEYGCYGFIAKLKESGSKIHAYIASLGSVGDPTSGIARYDESAEALSTLPLDSLSARKVVGLMNGDFNETLADLHRTIANIRPDLMLTLSPHDTHQEHRLVYELTIGAARRSNASIFCYSILSNTPEFCPNLFVDISPFFEAKKRALSYHFTQREKYYMSDEYLTIFHSDKYARLHGIEFCESYEIKKMFR